MTYRERREARAERLRAWADKRQRKSDASFESARRIADGIPMGQPILVGHHSERRHRRDVDRIHNGMSKGVEHANKAASMLSRADNIEAAAERAIYSDDPDACEALRDKIAGLEAKRARIKTVNAIVRKNGFEAALPALTKAEAEELIMLDRLVPYHKSLERGFPSYALTNLGGNINRAKARLSALEVREAQLARVRDVLDAERKAES